MIVGLTDRGLDFPPIGMIRKGAPKTEKRPGEDLDYFRVEIDQSEIELQRVFKALYGDKPTSIRVMLPFHTIERNWMTSCEGYCNGRLIARSDREYFQYLYNHKTKENWVVDGQAVVDVPEKNIQIGDKFPHFSKLGITENGNPIYCRPVGRLKVMIPEFARMVYLTLNTTSVYDIMTLDKQLKAIETVTMKRMAGVHMLLYRKPRIVTCTYDGKSTKQTKNLLNIEIAPEYVAGIMTSLRDVQDDRSPQIEEPSVELYEGEDEMADEPFDVENATL